MSAPEPLVATVDQRCANVKVAYSDRCTVVGGIGAIVAIATVALLLPLVAALQWWCETV